MPRYKEVKVPIYVNDLFTFEERKLLFELIKSEQARMQPVQTETERDIYRVLDDMKERIRTGSA